LKNNIASNKNIIFQLICFAVLSLFAFLPLVALVDPSKHGVLFNLFGAAAIMSLGVCLVWGIIRFAWRSMHLGVKSASKLQLSAIKSFFVTRKEALFLLIMYILVLVSAIFVSGTERSLKGTDFRPDGIYMYTVFFALYYFAVMLKNTDFKRIVTGFYILSFAVCAFVMVQQYLGILGSANAEHCPEMAKGLSNIYDRLGFRVGHFYKGETASFYNLNHMGYYTTIGACLCTTLFYKSKNIFSALFSAFLCAFAYWTLIVNNTFGCFIAVSVTILFFAIFLAVRKKVNFIKAFVPILVFILVCVGVTLKPFGDGESIISTNFSVISSDVKEISASENKEDVNAGSGRWKLWVNTVDMIREKPLLGYGVDNLKKEYTERGVKLDRAHCEILEHSVSSGIPAAILYISAILFAFFSALKKRNLVITEDCTLAPLMAVCAYAISALVGVFLFYTACHFIIMLGLIRE